MASPYGITYATGAISQAISDMFKGLNEGTEEQRKAAEEGRRTRAEMAEIAYQPIRFEQGRLANLTARQNIDLARSADQRAQEAERRTALQFPLHQRNLAANVQAAEVTAEFARKEAEDRVRNSQAAYEATQEQLKKARVEYPYLIPQLEQEAKTRKLAYDTATFNLDQAQKQEQGENQAAVALMGTRTLDEVEAVLKQYGQYIDPRKNAYAAYLMNKLETEARATGRINPLSVIVEKNNIAEAAQRLSTGMAERQLLSAYSPAIIKQGLEPGIDEARGYLIQYHNARVLMAREVPQLGIVYSEAEKNIPTMPQPLREALAKNEGFWRTATGLNFGYQERLGSINEADKYLVQGWEWTKAMQQGAADFAAKKRQGLVPSQKSQWRLSAFPPFFVNENDETIKPAVPGVLGPEGKPVPESALPPKVSSAPTKSPEMLRRDKLNAIAEKHMGVTWEMLQMPGNAAGKKWAEDRLEWEESQGR